MSPRLAITFALLLALTLPTSAQLTPVGPSVNLPPAGCYTINNDSFICRSIAGTFIVGTTATNGNGKLQLGDGTAASPTIQAFSANDGTGIILGGGRLGFSISGTEAARFNASGLSLGANGLNFSSTIGGATDASIIRAGPAELTISTLVFANLGTPASGTIAYCSDCTVTTAATCPGTQASCVCANGGAGAFARRVNGAWYCTF